MLYNMFLKGTFLLLQYWVIFCICVFYIFIFLLLNGILYWNLIIKSTKLSVSERFNFLRRR
ncbi:hypothetical protein SAMN05216365_14412 [Porphyromonadaceae bacterium NLAE-zl-C104]|nr:hypothetical protein SAMN05216365_14412 [Porphyromonadaceae bacterium NLAE-zl-C104]